MRIYETGRYYPHFPISLESRRQADWETIFSGGLADYIDSGEAVYVGERSGYHVSTWPPTGLSDPYNFLFYALPSKEVPIAKTFDELPHDASCILLNAAFASVGAIREVATANGGNADTIMVTQHVGPEDVNGYPFTTTLPHLHLHTHAYEESNLQSKGELFVLLETTKAENGKYLGHDPFFNLMFELVQSRWEQAVIHKPLSSLVLFEKSVDTGLEESEVKDIQTFFSQWKEVNHEIAGCFTDFEVDDRKRYRPLEKMEIDTRLRQLFIKYEQVLSVRSVNLLSFLAKRIKPSSDIDLWRWFFKGISGCSGYIFDYQQGIRKFVVAPRVRVIPGKNWIISDNPTHMVVKNRKCKLGSSAVEHRETTYMELNRCLSKRLKLS